MGFRTVVILSNDLMPEWENNPRLGKEIARASAEVGAGWETRGDVQPGCYVVEASHLDAQRLLVLDGLSVQVLATTNWKHGQEAEQRNLLLLKAAADAAGYRLVKKSK